MSSLLSCIRSRWFFHLTALVFLPIILHLVFSRYGLTLVDDGYILALAKRVLMGEIPHRDFVSIRPVFSAYFYAPLVLLGGGYTFLLGRLVVWFEMCFISWLFTELIAERSQLVWENWQKMIWIIVSVALSINVYPLMPWHTIDGMFFAALGIFFLVRSSRLRYLGAILLGCAAVCKQNFLPLVIGVPCVLYGKKSWKYIFLAFLPSLAYVIFLATERALPDFFTQVFSQSELLQPGIKQYLARPALYMGVATWMIGGFAVYYALRCTKRVQAVYFLIVHALALLPAVAFLTLFHFSWTFSLNICFALFGALLIVCVYHIICRPRILFDQKSLVPISVTLLMIGWSSSISLSANSPFLMIGPIVMVLLTLSLEWIQGTDPVLAQRHLKTFSLLLLVSVPVFFAGRYVKTDLAPYYHGQGDPAPSVLQGTRGLLLTPSQTAYYTDFAQALRSISPKPFVVVPDMAGFWVRSETPNAFSHDFPISLETKSPALFDRLLHERDALRSRGYVFIVPKYYQLDVFRRNQRKPDLKSEFANGIRQSFQRVGSTEFFEVYQ